MIKLTPERTIFRVFEDNIFVAFGQKIHLFNLSTQEGESISTVLDISKIKNIFADLRPLVFNDISDLQVTQDIFNINNFEIINISDKEISLWIKLKPYDKPTCVYFKGEVKQVLSYKLDLDIDYIGSYYREE